MLVARWLMAALFRRGHRAAVRLAAGALGRRAHGESGGAVSRCAPVSLPTPARALVADGGLCLRRRRAAAGVAMPDPCSASPLHRTPCCWLLALLEGGVRSLRAAGTASPGVPRWRDASRCASRLACTRPDFRRCGHALLSLGSALTLLVASTLVVHALLLTIEDTVPRSALALDATTPVRPQKDDFRTLVAASPDLSQLRSRTAGAGRPGRRRRRVAARQRGLPAPPRSQQTSTR